MPRDRLEAELLTVIEGKLKGPEFSITEREKRGPQPALALSPKGPHPIDSPKGLGGLKGTS